MMTYTISYNQPHKKFVDITFIVSDIQSEELEVQLPAWRPGRYELANYAKNIQLIEAKNKSGEPLTIKKITKDKWLIKAENAEEVHVTYNYYAAQLDGGGCWLDEEQLYLNFINCLFYVEGRQEEACKVKLDLPKDYEVACGLKAIDGVITANSYYELVDSPLMASASLQYHEFLVSKKRFHIWIMGECSPDFKKMEAEFSAFAEEQMNTMGDVPFDDYHFLFQVLPYKFYHGVEHTNSTVIVLGPGESWNDEALYKEMLGVSSHELFHSWNVCSIRPKELYPYDFSKENYYETGYVTEGVTTYYGDYFLARSGVLTQEQYFDELNKIFKRHFDNYGRFNRSVADSSFDLWLDGYMPGIPHRKTSIYMKGAVAALILDLDIRRFTNNGFCLDDVMRLLWQRFALQHKGYSKKDYQQIVEEVAGVSFQQYFDDCIDGVVPMEKHLNHSLEWVGCTLIKAESEKVNESTFGFRVAVINDKVTVIDVAPGSPADEVLTRGDVLININGEKAKEDVNDLLKDNNKLLVDRHYKATEVALNKGTEKYYSQFFIKKSANATDAQRDAYAKWLKQPF